MPKTLPETSESAPDSAVPASWQRQLAEAIRHPQELLRRLTLPEIPAADAKQLQQLASAFPLLVPQSFLNRMQPGNPDDPLLRQVMLQREEFIPIPGFSADPVNDKAARQTPGLLRKYQGRTLLITTGACAIHCRYCFRREYPYHDVPRQLSDWMPALQQIAEDSSITEVLLSGGDPLLLTDDRLQWLCQQLDAIPHIERIRLHTRLPIVLPARITGRLLEMLTGLRSQVMMVVHANHGNEIVNDCADTLKNIVRAGLPVLNQAVLLRGINDTVDDLELLCRRLINIGVLPYYLHQLDQVNGAAHFEVDVAAGKGLIMELAKRLPGYAVPRYVREIPGEASKTAL